MVPSAHLVPPFTVAVVEPHPTITSMPYCVKAHWTLLYLTILSYRVIWYPSRVGEEMRDMV